MGKPDSGVVSAAPVPADQGLSTLGMLMQLAGNLWAAMMSIVCIGLLAQAEWQHVKMGDVLIMLLVIGSMVARSLVHRQAGNQLLYGDGRRFSGVWKYIGFSLVQTIAVCIVFKLKMEFPTKPVLRAGAALLLWPAVLGVVCSLPRFKRFDAGLPLPEDKGFEGASIVMTVLGVCGVLAVGTALLVLFDVPDSEITNGPNVLVLMMLIMLLVRSGLHAHAGLTGLRETSVDTAVYLGNRYANFGVISSFCAAAAMMMFQMAQGVDVMAFGSVAAIVWLLLAWPLVVRKFFSDRQFAELLAGDGTHTHHRAPDAGLTSLGWMLIAFSVVSGSQLILGTGYFDAGDLMSRVISIGAPTGLRSVWWNVGLTVFQAWAGVELVRMSPQSRVIATAYGAVGTAVTLYVSWPLLEAIKHAEAQFAAQRDLSLQFGIIALQILVPVATALLVNRRTTPIATARFKSRSAQPSS